ncbi:MAG TPA: 50S ribosomal protein L35 [candidate division CPR3 bacterium]|uniref:Large ribosomal subunit protein bL35 n=1 Tax=candidate division CPR3 bacterium TaxID=2268181 RepID=A0A7C1SNP9_UNCC3|nr:50S ribosomal protein L35 [candidate division CPR3 bacterium]
MPKIKTRKSIQKRFKITKTGKVLRRATGQDHFRTKKSSKAKRQKRKWIVMPKVEAKKIVKALHS